MIVLLLILSVLMSGCAQIEPSLAISDDGGDQITVTMVEIMVKPAGDQDGDGKTTGRDAVVYYKVWKQHVGDIGWKILRFVALAPDGCTPVAGVAVVAVPDDPNWPTYEGVTNENGVCQVLGVDVNWRGSGKRKDD